VLFRGLALSTALSNELSTGAVNGQTVSLYKGRLDHPSAEATITRGEPLEQVPWWVPEGMEDEPGHLTETVGMTGGFTPTIGSALAFGPVILFLDGVSGSRVRYSYRYFNNTPGALAWVYGDNIEGEIRAEDEGLVGLTSMGSGGPVVWRWGRDDLERDAMTYEDEDEVLVPTAKVDIGRSLETVMLVLEARRTPASMLATFEEYSAGFGSGEDVSRWSTGEVLGTLHEEIERRSAVDIPEMWTLNLSTTCLEKMGRIQPDGFDYAYDGEIIYDEHSAVPDRLLGGQWG